MIDELTNEHIGVWVVTLTGNLGRIKSYDNQKKRAWVVFSYHCNKDWKNFLNYGGRVVRYKGIKFAKYIPTNI